MGQVGAHLDAVMGTIREVVGACCAPIGANCAPVGALCRVHLGHSRVLISLTWGTVGCPLTPNKVV